MEIFNEWWSSLDLSQKVYWCIAIPFSLIFIFQTIMTIIGTGETDQLDATGDGDSLVGDDSGIPFQFISLKNLVAFFTIFGWTGIAALSSGWSTGVTLTVSFIAGLLMMLVMATIFYYMNKLTEDGSFKIRNTIGKSGSVYLSIPANREGTGKVQINVQGFQTLDAITDSDTEIKTGSVITVTDVINGNLLLVK